MCVVVSSAPRRSSESGNQQQSDPNCNQIFRDCNRSIRNVKALNEPGASLIAAKRSCNSADCSDQRSEPIRRAPSNGETCTSKQANDNSCSEPDGRGTSRSGREFIGNEFAQGAKSKYAHRPGRTHESQGRTMKINPAQVRGPSYNRRRRHGSQPRYDAN